LRVQDKKNEAQSDSGKGLRRNSGQRVIIELHLRSLETQIKEMRRRRVEAQRKPECCKPGKPMQNGFIERFNRSYREAVLDMSVFQSLSEVREQTEKWLREYNEERPHESLGNMTPREYLLTRRKIKFCLF
jgi:hypothetical protein